MCNIGGKADDFRVIINAPSLLVSCVPGKAASPCQLAVSPSINIGSVSPCGIAREQLAALCAEHQPPGRMSLVLYPLRVNGNRRWAAEIPVNKAQLLGQRTKMRTSPYTAPRLLLPPARAPGWKLLLESPFLLLKVSPFTQTLFICISFHLLERFFSLRQVKVPWNQVVSSGFFSKTEAQGFQLRRGFDQHFQSSVHLLPVIQTAVPPPCLV